MSGGFLSRWSRRKLAAAVQAAPERDPASAATAPAVPGDAGAESVGRAAPEAGAVRAAAPTASAEAQLPPVESLSLSSDFTAFLKEEVSEALRRKALHKLFSDPHFNQMDGLDIYIDDYSQPDPIPPEAMAKLQHAREWLMGNEEEPPVEVAPAVRDASPADGGRAAPNPLPAGGGQATNAMAGGEADAAEGAPGPSVPDEADGAGGGRSGDQGAGERAGEGAAEGTAEGASGPREGAGQNVP